MNILFITSAHNSMSRRAYIELTELGHEVHVHLALGENEMISAVNKHEPDLIVAPMLKKAIPEVIWRNYTCLIVHPGIKGDRGPSSLDWAILKGAKEWGVTILQANEEMDAGDIWASINFKIKDNKSKSELYRHDVTEAAIKGLRLAIERFEKRSFVPEPLDYNKADVNGTLHTPMKQKDRSIDWSKSTTEIAVRIRSADSQPGVLDSLFNEQYFLYGVHEEDKLKGAPGEIIAKRDGAICRATGDGAVWITHLKKRTMDSGSSFKVPAVLQLGSKLANIPEDNINFDEVCEGRTYREIWYEEKNNVGYLYFNFYNGAMSTEQCKRLRAAYLSILNRKTKAVVLMGGSDFWSNGIHLNVIEASSDPAQESWENINAMNDLVKEIINTNSKIVISAMQGNAGAGGVILALAADKVFARKGVVLNPHYKGMGGLYGSEYWTYLLPKRVGRYISHQLTEYCISLGTSKAKEIGLIDDCFEENVESFCQQVVRRAEELVDSMNYEEIVQDKDRKRKADEKVKPLEQYRNEELEEMWKNFFSPNSLYHEARKNFVNKVCPTCSTVKINKLASEMEMI